MYQYFENILTIEARILFNKEDYDLVKAKRKAVLAAKKKGDNKELAILKIELEALSEAYKLSEKTFITRPNYDYKKSHNKITVLTKGGNGRSALVEWESLPTDLQQKVMAVYGDPYKVTKRQGFTKYLEYDLKAFSFFSEFVKSDGSPLSKKQITKWTAQSNVLNAITALIEERQQSKMAFGKSIRVLWQNIAVAIHDLDPQTANRYPHNLGKNWKRLRQKHEQYLNNGYHSLLHSGIDNDNSKKIKGAAADWLIAMYSMPNKITASSLAIKYNEICDVNQWAKLTPGAIAKWLDQPDQARLWMLSRDGREEYNKRFGYKVKRDKSRLFPNSWWAIDGTKLDWLHYFDNSTGLAAKLKIDIVIDVYSEKIIGWSYSETENHTDHFKAIKMAVNNSNCRPYLLNYDNQGGHKTKRMQELYDQIVAQNGGAHVPNKPYRHSNPIEQVFSRFQQQTLNQLWFSDKQSVKSRATRSVPNIDFLLANKHLLKTKEELKRAFEMCVMLWNDAKHPHFAESRTKVFEHEMPMHEPFEFMDQVNTFWINETRAKKYYAHGMPLTVAGQKFDFEVYDADGNIDLEFRRKYVGAKFIVKYDPEYLNQFVQLWQEDVNGNRTFIANAEPKRTHQQVPALMQPGEKAQFLKDFSIVETEYNRDKAQMEAIQQRTGITPERLIEEQDYLIKMGGKLPKKQRTIVESTPNINIAEGL